MGDAAATATPAETARGVAWTAWPFYPFLVGVWSVILLFGQNLGEVDPIDTLLPMVWSLAIAGALLAAAYMVVRDIRAAALLAAGLELLFLSFGRVLLAIDSPLVTSGRLVIAFGVIGLILIFVAWRFGSRCPEPDALAGGESTA